MHKPQLDPPLIGVYYLCWYNYTMGRDHFAKTMRSPYFTMEQPVEKCQCNKMFCKFVSKAEAYLKSKLSNKNKKI